MADGDTITAALFNDEFNRLLTAFSYASSSTTGHQHDGTAAEGGNIHTIGDQDFLNKIVADSTNNRWGFFVEVSSSAVEQIRIQDGAIVPVTDNDIDLGTSSLEFKDAYFDGTVTTDALVADTADINGGTVDGATLGTNSAITQAVIDNVNINGTTIGHTDDTDLITLADGVVTIAGELDATTLDISGNADIDGTLEADAYTVDGTALNEFIADTVGAMVGSNTETNITVTYEDGDNTLDFVIGTLNQDTTGTADNFTVSANNSTDETVYPIFVDGATGSQGAESDTGLTYNPSSGLLTISGELDAGSLDISGNADIDGTLEADAITVDGTALNEFIADTVGAMVGSNTESGITVAYQDGDNTLDFTVGTLNQDTTGTAAIATTVTITDNESTNENNALIFTAGGDLDGGNLGLESDGDLIYNPSTGLLSSTGVTASGTVTFGTLSDGTIGVTAWVDEDNMSSDSATLIPTQQSVKAYVDSQTSGSGSMSNFILEDDDGTEVTVSNAKEVKFIGSGLTTNWTDTDNGTDGDPYDLTFTVDAAQTGITSLLATDIKIGEDDQTKIDFEDADKINFYAGNEKQLILEDGALYPGSDNIIDLGKSDNEFKDAFFDGTVTADAFAGPLTGNVTGNASGTALTVTQAAQSAITSLGTLTTLTVDNVIVNGTTIGHTDDTDLMTLADGVLTVAGEVSLTTLDIGGTNVTSTAAELNILDGVTSTATELNLMDGGTSAGTTAVASGDGIVTNDGGTMRQTTVATFDTYFSASTKTLTNKTLGAVTLSGAVTGGDQTISAVNLKDYGEVTNAIGATGGGTQDIDLTAGNSVTATVDTSANTFTFSNPTASDELCGFTLTLTNGGSQTVNWPGGVDWAGGTAPTLTESGVDVLIFYTTDGGTRWYGFLAGANLS